MKPIYIAIILLAGAFFGYQQVMSMDKMETPMKDRPENTASAVFAGGCFWCSESDFEKVDGVLEVISGYTGGREADPTYAQVSAGRTGHLEAVKVVYDPAKITYPQLLDAFWRHIDPTDSGGQFVDRGPQYRSAIFYADESERVQAEESAGELAASGRFSKPIATEISPRTTFYPAEEYHQDYYRKNPLRYKWYRSGSGRDPFIEKVWTGAGQAAKTRPADDDTDKARPYRRPADDELRQRLSAMQYKVVRQNGTEPPFNNEYWDHHGAGIYVDIASGEPLFSSADKFDSGTGWPSFTKPLVPKNIVEHTDRSLFMVRTEVRSRHGDSHLGHLFGDGPAPTGRRYCINSAALRFIAAADLEKEGLGQYYRLFE